MVEAAWYCPSTRANASCCARTRMAACCSSLPALSPRLSWRTTRVPSYRRSAERPRRRPCRGLVGVGERSFGFRRRRHRPTRRDRERRSPRPLRCDTRTWCVRARQSGAGQGAIALTTVEGNRFDLSVPGHHHDKVFWSSDGPRIEAVGDGPLPVPVALPIGHNVGRAD